MYKTYVSNGEIYEFVANDSVLGGFEPVRLQCDWQPVINPELGILVEGLHQLKQFPFGRINPCQFAKDHFPYMQNCMDRMSHFFSTHPDILDDWHKFANDLYPQTPCAEEYVRQHGLYVPLQGLLFKNSIVLGPPRSCQTAITSYPVSIADDDFIPPTKVAISLPTVRQNSTRRNTMFLPPRVYADQQQQSDLSQNKIKIRDLRDIELRRPLKSQDAYEMCTCEELKVRLEFRGCPIGKSRPNKSDYVKRYGVIHCHER